MQNNFAKSLLAYLDELEIPYQTRSKKKSTKVSEIVFENLESVIRLHYLGDETGVLGPQLVIGMKHLWEDQWIHQQGKVKSKIRSLAGLTTKFHGRQTELVKLNNDQLIHFLENNHMNVPIRAKHKYGLSFENELLAVMSFSKGRSIQRDGVEFNSFELLRYCNKLNVTVVGGVSKLLKHFIKEQSPDDIMTYVDADWSDGKTLESLGFVLAGYMDPIRFYFNMKSGKREYEEILRKQLGLSVDQSLEDRMTDILNAGYLPVYNSGSYKYILKLKSLAD